MPLPLRLAVVLGVLCSVAAFNAASLGARADQDGPVRPAQERPDSSTSAGAAEPGDGLLAVAATRRASLSGSGPARPATSGPGRAVSAGHRVRLLARVRRGRSILAHRSPRSGGRRRLGARTEFGSPRVLAVAAARGEWLGVASSARTDGRLMWVHARSEALELAPAPVTIEVDLSTRRLALRRGSRVLRRVPVAVGRPGSTTPTGRFAVTDRLSGPRFGS